MPVRGIRGATTVTENTEQTILTATRELLGKMVNSNPGLQPEEIASAWFTVTPDLNAAYPAKAARQLGWQSVPLLCTQEIPVPDGLPMCIRVLLHWNTDRSQVEIQHVYLGEAESLRPDLSNSNQ
ncbi:MAG: chorismate mutase [Anaerolineaceae bacterium]|nr:chorismate mutase [Anaerolineaceae bacterium]